MQPVGQAIGASPLDDSQVFPWSQVSCVPKMHIPLLEDTGRVTMSKAVVRIEDPPGLQRHPQVRLQLKQERMRTASEIKQPLC